MKLKYTGESFYSGFGLTKDKTYECLGIELNMLRIIDDEEEDYLYPANIGWEIIEDKDGELKTLLNNVKGA